MKRWLTPVVAATSIVAVALPAQPAGATVAGTIVLASGTSHSPNPVRLIGASSSAVDYNVGDFSTATPFGASIAGTIPAAGAALGSVFVGFQDGTPQVIGNRVSAVNFNNDPQSIDYQAADGSDGTTVNNFSLVSGESGLAAAADGEWVMVPHSGDSTVDVIDHAIGGTEGAAINIPLSDINDFTGNNQNFFVSESSDSDGLALVYPEAASGGCANDTFGNPQTKWHVVFVDTSVHTLATTGCTSSFINNLTVGSGVVAWVTSDTNGGNLTINWLPVSSAGGTPLTQAVSDFPAGVAVTSTQIGWELQGAFAKLHTEPIGGGTVTNSTFTVESSGFNTLFSTGTNFVFAADDGSLAAAGPYEVSDAAGTPTLLASNAGTAAALKATAIALAPGRVAYTTNDTTTDPIWQQTLTNSGSSLTQGTPSVLATHATDLSLSLSGNRTEFSDVADGASGAVYSVKLQTGAGAPTTIASSTDTEPLPSFAPSPAHLSGQRVLYPAMTSGSNPQPEFKIYDVVTGASSAVLDQTTSAAYLWGNYLVWVTNSGAVNRKDLVTGVTQLIHQTALDTSGGVFGQVAAYGSTVAWNIGTCTQNSGCNNDAAFVNVAPGATPGTPTTFNGDGNTVAVSAGYVGYVDGTSGKFNVLPTAGGSATEVSANQMFGGRFALDGNTAAWTESLNNVQTPEAAPLPVTANRPWFLGNPTAPASYTIGSGTWNGEMVTSAGLTSCTVAITHGTTLIRTLSCDATKTGLGDAVVSWDGRDSHGFTVASGTYSWTVNAANLDGTMLNYDGSSTAVTGNIAVTNPDVTAPSVTLRSAGSLTNLSKSIPVRWSATDAGSGVASYDVRYRRAAWNGGFGSYAMWKSGTTATSATLTGSPGYEYCFSVRARDHAGNVSGWTAQKCAAIPLDDRSLSASSGWKNITGSAFYLGTARQTAKKGVTLTRKGAIAGRAVLILDRGKNFGSIAVLYNGKVVKTFSLSYTKTQTKYQLALPKITKGTTVVIKTTSTRVVEVDGLLLARV